MLDDLKLKDSYSSDNDNLIKDFYNPTLECAVTYDRITGYFSPAILSVAARGFAGLIHNKGRIRVITSIKVESDLYESINNIGDINEEILNNFSLDLEALHNELQKNYLKVFMYLYKSNQLQLKIAVLKDGYGILHQKVGIISDKEGNAISFSGSNNETPNGALNNLEEFKVFRNWTISSSPYFADDVSKFEKLWNNTVESVKVLTIDNAIKEKLIEITKTTEKIDSTLQNIKKLEDQNQYVEKNLLNNRQLRDYQIEAIDHWVNNNYISIFEMATGTGKTFTAINAIKKINENMNILQAIIVVPLVTLTIQWQDDIRKNIEDVIIINTSTKSNWKRDIDNLIHLNELGNKRKFIIITSYAMFGKTDFQQLIKRLSNEIILVADEMHNLVNYNRLKALSNPSFKYKLGLSATPTRLWQQAESDIARKHFGNNSFQFSLKDAIEKGFLVTFNYHPLPIHLTYEEYEEYIRLSREIQRLYNKETDPLDQDTALNMKLIARSRIKKNAENKIVSLETTLNELQKNEDLFNALIYVDNEEFLKEIQVMLTKNNIRTTKFIGSNSLDERLSAIQNLRSHAINAIIAIKCLDEGVDIPSASNAFFISNNTDPREYVQRLGRVLRKDPQGSKKLAEVYDYLVMPPIDVNYENDNERKIARNMVKNELIRSKFFIDLAINSETAKDTIDNAVDIYGFYFEEYELIYTTGEDNELID